MTDWATISSLATAGGTLVLAVATFAAVRSANRSARATERALLADILPLVVPSRQEDPPEKVGFVDQHWVKVPGGRAVVEVADGVIYMAIALRNVGRGLAVLDRWDIHRGRPHGDGPRDPDQFRRLNRDIYVPAGDLGFWQGALRDPDDPAFAAARDALADGETITIDLLYGDHEGGQRRVSRFNLIPRDDEPRVAVVSRHWNLDGSSPR